MSNQTFSNVDKSDSNTHKQTDFNLPKNTEASKLLF
jgi:hypothetical protein